MKISIKNLTNSSISCDTFSLTAGQSLVVDVPDQDLQVTVQQLALLGSKIQYAVSSVASQLVISQPLTVYVDMAGNDNNDGDVARPFRTIQAAINYLRPFRISALVTIQVNAGSYDGFAIDNPNVSMTTGSCLRVLGTTTVVDSGTITSTSGLLKATQTLTDNTKSWTVNQFVGYRITINGSPAVIVSNTATDLFVVAAATSLSGKTYVIEKNLTLVNGTPVTVPHATTLAMISLSGVDSDLPSASAAALLTTSPILISNIDIVQGVSSTRCVYISGRLASVSMYECSVTGATGFGVQANAGALAMHTCYVSAGGLLIVSVGSSNIGSPATMRATSCAFVAAASTATALSIAGGGFVVLTTSYITSPAGTGMSTIGGSALPFCDFNTCVTGIDMSGPSPFSPSTLTLNASSFTNCTTAIAATHSMCFIGALSGATSVVGSGNTTGILLTKGARMVLSTGMALTATTEVSVDGATTTFAAIRALSPKVFPAAANAYGTCIYE